MQSRARDMRNNPTEPEKRLWRNLSNGQLAGHKFRRQAVIGPYIADFVCPSKRLIVEVDGHTHAAGRDAVRDSALAAQGYRVLRVNNDDVMRNMEGVLRVISDALDEQAVARADGPHPNPSPEGEGLSRAHLEGSVG
ncbi:endonuclease domain-containing protein [Sandaracinobacter neustonicus]|uniref:endonuclease domain-containing protein n=1 Tax=Sandaracinobacter neustonicus TaxID=1715348 RepID=UPI0022A6AE48|nr:endonuclease domain-containing protein [Sandaracinobacter neustonicus]